MPELPEVQTVVTQLARPLPGRAIQSVEVSFPDLLAESSETFADGMLGLEIVSVDRRGKNIVIRFADEGRLVVNLGMTGRLMFLPSDGDPHHPPVSEPTHPAVRFGLAPSGTLLYADVRRFGSLRRYDPAAWRRESARLGPEPLGRSLTGPVFADLLSRSRTPIRSWLLDQTRIAGIGNIYANEALFRVGIHPARPAWEIRGDQAHRLLRSLRRVLREAIEARGTTLRDYRTAAGETGSFGPELRVYGRDGDPCRRCNTPIERIVFGNRSAFVCPSCQGSP